jgi:hypothetical protein
VDEEDAGERQPATVVAIDDIPHDDRAAEHVAGVQEGERDPGALARLRWYGTLIIAARVATTSS